MPTPVTGGFAVSTGPGARDANARSGRVRGIPKTAETMVTPEARQTAGSRGIRRRPPAPGGYGGDRRLQGDTAETAGSRGIRRRPPAPGEMLVSRGVLQEFRVTHFGCNR